MIIPIPTGMTILTLTGIPMSTITGITTIMAATCISAPAQPVSTSQG